MVAARKHWRSAAACRFADPELFFPVSSSVLCLEQEAKAKAICARCQVRPECLAFALRTWQLHGVWGGMGEQERYLLWRAEPTETAPRQRPRTITPVSAPRRGPAQRD